MLLCCDLCKLLCIICVDYSCVKTDALSFLQLFT